MKINLLSLLKQRSVYTLLVLVLYSVTADMWPITAQQGFYTTSLLIKDLLMWMMPLTVGFFIASTVCSFERQAPLFIITLLIFEGLSNLGSVWYAFAGAHLAADWLPAIKAAPLSGHFTPLWRLPFTKPVWWAADKGCLLGLVLGCLTGVMAESPLKSFIHQGKEAAEWMLTRIFAPLIPLFILGFAAQMHQTGLLTHMANHYAVLLLWLVGLLIIYIVSLFAAGAGKSLRTVLRHIKNLLPAGGISLTSGCSLSTMPWTIAGAAKNLQHPDLAKAIIPATTNIQQVGDCIANAFLCFLIYRHFYGHNPDLLTWVHFSSLFVLARFTTAAVLGGAIFIMLPIYESTLGFTSEMTALILALNVILDPLITSCNVMANGALCRVFEKVWNSSFLTAIPFSKPVERK